MRITGTLHSVGHHRVLMPGTNTSGMNEADMAEIAEMIAGWSIEVMPRTAAKIEDFRAILPEGTRIYIAHIDGTPIDDMVATARRLHEEGFPVMPHLPIAFDLTREP